MSPEPGGPHRCHDCGGATRVLLENHRVGLGRRVRLCPPCRDVRRQCWNRRYGRVLLAATGLVALGVGLDAAGGVPLRGPVRGLLQAGALAWTFLVCGQLVMPLHELGHVVAARLAGLDVYRVTLGDGDRPRMFRGGGATWHVFPPPWTRGVTVWGTRTPAGLRRRVFVAVLGGPLAHVVLGAALLLAVGPPGVPGARSSTGELAVTAAWAANAWILAANLLPQAYRGSGRRTRSDGVGLFLTPRMSDAEVTRVVSASFALEAAARREVGKLAEARELIEQGIAGQPEWVPLRLDLALVLHDLGDHAAARRELKYALSLSGTPPAVVALLRHSLAWIDLRSGRPELLPEADQASDEAFADLGWDAHVKAGRGAVLVETDRCPEGVSLLAETVGRTGVPAVEAVVAGYLALGLAALGRIDRARAELARAVALDPALSLLERASAAVADAEAGGTSRGGD